MSKVLHTKFGTAKLDSNGYYKITSKKEGNSLKFLHRLIFEEHHRLTILPNNIIHHLDGNPQNNKISNLKLISHGEHSKLHRKNIPLSEKSKLNMSKAQNTSGYYRVMKEKCSRCKQGFYYKYKYYENGKRKAISSVSLRKLERKVKENGLTWKKLNGE
ncbi:MAG: HNH endonuclease [Methanobrevibacter sp.]|nr:HNH endonuclease [Methanobrevibacter sp.]